MKHIIFIVGSSRKNSFNRQLADTAKEIMSNHFDISFLDFKDIPFMNQDLESQFAQYRLSNHKETANSNKTSDTNDDTFIKGMNAIMRVREEIKKADGIWVFCPEYNHSYPAVIKNLFDWLSRPNDFRNFADATVIKGKKITVSGAGGKNKTESCREKLNELFDYIKMDVMKEGQCGVELGINAWTKGEFSLTEEQTNQLKNQAEMFTKFIG